MKDPRGFKLVINARIEGIADKPAFRDALRVSRCIVPASGYYEWQLQPDGSKQPYFIAMADGSPMAFAGLYAVWQGPSGEPIELAAIVTTEAGDDTVGLHDRTPAVLRGDQIDAWLDTAHVPVAVATALVAPLEAGAVVYHPVDRGIGAIESRRAEAD